VATYRLFPSTNGPSAATSYSGSYSTSTSFAVLGDGKYLSGYWWWLCTTNSPPTGPQKFCLWQDTSGAAGLVIPAATVTSSTTFVPGWNYVPLPAPVPLSKDGAYRGVTAPNAPFPFTTGQYGSGQPYAAGITNGPLKAYSDVGGSAPNPYNNAQCGYQTGNADPAGNIFPADGNGSFNGWLDIQVQDTAPAVGSYRLWPSYSPIVTINSQTIAYTLATEIVLSQACTLNRIWFYSPNGATILPTQCAVWDESTQLVVPGTNNTSPSWSGAPGTGWVSCAYSGITLPAGHYRPAIFGGGTGAEWFAVTVGYFVSGTGGASGISTGPITAPNNTNATAPGQPVYNTPTWAYPNTWSSAGNGENYWVDVEVTPVAATSQSSALIGFFP
jgi:hypothetical protein